jgi:hypothetical protein
MNDIEVTTHRLIHSTPDEVYRWLEESLSNRHSPIPELERVLLDRKLPLVTLGLALFGRDHQVVAEIYNSGDNTLKKAVLSGVSVKSYLECWVRSSGLLAHLIENKNKDLLASFLRNKHIPEDVYLNFFEQKHEFKDLDQEYFLDLLWEAKSNELFPKTEEEKFICQISPLQIYDRHLNEKFITKLSRAYWQLFDNLQPTARAAGILNSWAGCLIVEDSALKDPLKTIARWKGENSSERESSEFQDCRFRLGTLIRSNNLKDHADIALRKSYYATFNFKSPDALTAMLEKDGDDFIESACENIWLYRSQALRHRLIECVVKHSFVYHRGCIYERTRDLLHKIMPEWFFDENGADAIYLEHVKDPQKWLCYGVNHFAKRVESLVNSTGEQEENKLDKLLQAQALMTSRLSELKSIIYLISLFISIEFILRRLF